MMKGLLNSLAFLLSGLIVLTVAATCLAWLEEWEWLGLTVIVWFPALRMIQKLYGQNARKIAFMFDAIDNADYAFKYATGGRFSSDKLVNRSLNRITKILSQAKADTARKEKYYELIMNSVTTGIIVIDDNGYIYQINNEALRLIGLSVFTHAKQLRRIDEQLAALIMNIQPGTKRQTTFTNERGIVHLSVRASEATLQHKHVRIIAINDINSELDDKEIDSWIRLTRVLTHEIMNSITPITSLSDTLLSIHEDANKDIRNGLNVISATGKSLISFVESYRRFTHIPEPRPSLFYVKEFVRRMVQLTTIRYNNYPNITITIDVQPEDLIVYADENLIGQVALNLLTNAMQAIGEKQPDGRICVKAYCNEKEAVLIEVGNNGPPISPEETEHIFIPFFTTKEGGSGIGLSISRQIMRLSGGSITLKSMPATRQTTFILTFS
jgi:PAS domain S-box-containing protein